jgi:superfamily II DNA or RNA helicase
MKLRSYQSELAKTSAGSDNVLIQADTGSGKTRILAKIATQNRHVLCIAHRTILVKQLSRELAKFNIIHDVFATTHTIRQCIIEHRKLGINCTLTELDLVCFKSLEKKFIFYN